MEVDFPSSKEEKEITLTTYQGETSRSIVSRARKPFEQYRAAMKKLPQPRAPPPSQGGLGEAGTGERGQWDGEEEGTSWMADHIRSHHDGQMSSNPMDDYDFLALDQFRKPLQRQIGLIQVKEEGWTGFSEGWQGCSE